MKVAYRNLIYSKNGEFKILRHLLFWIFICLYLISCGYNNSFYFYITNLNFIYIPINILTTYTILYFFLPKYFSNNRFPLFFFKCFSLLIFYIGLNLMLVKGFTNHWINYIDNEFLFKVTSNIKVFIIINIPAIFIKVLKKLYLINQVKQNLEKCIEEDRMTVLTSQLHPHFLFNTLNNLYLLSIEKSEKAPDIIMKLSDVMRYIMDDRDKKYVELTRELEVIKSYIEIEKLRYDKDLKIESNINLTDFEKTSILIPPLLIFTLVENAFKHGVSNSLDNPWINIQMFQNDTTFKVNIGNSVDDCCKNETGRKGIGLQNVQKRLELYYPEKNKYSINKMRNKYIVNLEIKMNNENEMFNSG